MNNTQHSYKKKEKHSNNKQIKTATENNMMLQSMQLPNNIIVKTEIRTHLSKYITVNTSSVQHIW